jgi:hypothetical protein
MDIQTFFIRNRTYTAIDPLLQDALACVYESSERPRCLCVRSGIEMYVAKHRQYQLKRMPDTGPGHHPSCPSFEPDTGQSGLGELMGDAVIEHSPESIELRVDFPLSRVPGRIVPSVRKGEPQEPSEVHAPRHRISLRALMNFLIEKSGFNRWYPAMAGKRSQGVIRKYVMEAAEEIRIKGVRLSERLYIPEPFQENRKEEIAERRRERLSILHSPEDGERFKMALVLAEFKAAEASYAGHKIWVKHMPDCPLLVDDKTWERTVRAFGSYFEARDADTKTKLRPLMCALIYAKREHSYQVDTLSFMLTTEQWIPVEGTHEVNLLHALTAQQRRFMKPLRYDAKSAAHFPNVLLLDTGDRPTPLHVVGGDARSRAAKEKALKAADSHSWIWYIDKPMPELPAQAR